MFQEMLDQQPLIDEADDLHLAAAFGAFQKIDFPLFQSGCRVQFPAA
jgi:hypothetical protein